MMIFDLHPCDRFPYNKLSEKAALIFELQAT